MSFSLQKTLKFAAFLVFLFIGICPLIRLGKTSFFTEFAHPLSWESKYDDSKIELASFFIPILSQDIQTRNLEKTRTWWKVIMAIRTSEVVFQTYTNYFIRIT